MLKAVTFDLWGTLIKDTQPGSCWAREERVRRIHEVLREQQIRSSPETINRAYDLVGKKLDALWVTLRDIGARAQVEFLLDFLQIDHALRSDSLLDRLVEAYTFPILSALPKPIDAAHEVLETLAARGLRLAVICNTGRTPGKVLRIILERLHLSQRLSVLTFSDELGLRKPHPEIFDRTLAALGVEPWEGIHVGDTLESDIVGARSFGMRSIHLCHSLGSDPSPHEGETIFSLPDLLPLLDGAPAQN